MQHYIKPEHYKRLSTVRIQRIVLKNFKNVDYGRIVLDCGRHFVPQGTSADILGVYGQNGSGKTSIIEALAILKQVMSGNSIPDSYSNCISNCSSYAQIEFTFDFQYNDNRRRKVDYSFKLKSVENNESDFSEESDEIVTFLSSMLNSEKKLVVYDENIYMSGDFYGDTIKYQAIIDTSSEDIKNPFLPVSKRKFFLGHETDEILLAQSVNKAVASKSSKSYIFMDETMKSFFVNSKASEYYEVLAELKLFAAQYLYVIDTKVLGTVSTNKIFPLYSVNSNNRAYNIFSEMLLEDDEKVELDKVLGANSIPNLLSMGGPSTVDLETFEKISKQFDNINIVLEQIVPGMQVKFKKISDTLTKKLKQAVVAELVSCRDGNEMPFSYESDGIKKIISVLELIIKAYNQKSTTIAIDELDSGVFEYLLGEILETFQDGGHGQFIFTSHNLRPLEIIDKNFLYFTTANPKNRYVRLKNIGKTNNLRNVYYREIVLGEQDDVLYKRTQQHKIALAFRKAGRIDGEAKG